MAQIGNISAATSASRTSGVAPLTIFFDATGIGAFTLAALEYYGNLRDDARDIGE